MPRPNTEAVEDYAKAIYGLAPTGRGTGRDLGARRRLGVSPGTVTAMLKRMAELGLVEHRPYHGVVLTAAGERVALEVIRHHRLLEAYLADALGMPWDKIHAEAEVLEHYISEELEERIATALGDPSHDPHGDPIPDRELLLADGEGVALAGSARARAGSSAASRTPTRRCCATSTERGIRPGIEVRVERRDPFEGPMLHRASGATRTRIGARARRGG